MSDAPAPSPSASAAGRRKSVWIMAAIAVVVIAFDQATKTWVEHALAGRPPRHIIWTLQLIYTENTGAAFSLGTGITPILVALAVGVFVVMLIVSRSITSPGRAPAMGLVLGGALGNLCDRLIRNNGGGVIDWIDLQWWPVWNVADAAVSIGATALVIFSFVDGRRADQAERTKRLAVRDPAPE